MKKQAYMTMILIMLMTVVGLSTVKAQTNSASRLTATIPFSFNVGQRSLPAGEYTVRCTNPASDSKVLQLRNANGDSAMILTNSVSGKQSNDAKLVFNRYGDHYYFAQAWLPADSIGMQAIKSGSEKRIERELAVKKASRETVAVIAHR